VVSSSASSSPGSFGGSLGGAEEGTAAVPASGPGSTENSSGEAEVPADSGAVKGVVSFAEDNLVVPCVQGPELYPREFIPQAAENRPHRGQPRQPYYASTLPSPLAIVPRYCVAYMTALG
jgi:hypothetical protein